MRLQLFDLAYKHGELSPDVCPSPERQTLDAYDDTGKADKNRGKDGSHGAVRLFPDGGGRRAEGAICFDTEPD